MIQRVEKLPDVHFQNPAASAVHRPLPQVFQGFVCRSSRPEAIRAGIEVLLVDRLQQHDDRPLEDLVLQRGNSDRASLGSRARLGNMHPPHRRCPVRPGLRPVQERLEVGLQVFRVLGPGLSVHARCPVLAGPVEGRFEPVDVHQIGQRSESHLRRSFRQLGYPLLFREYAHRISKHSAYVPTTSPCSRCLASLPGVRSGDCSPASTVLSRHCDFLPSLPPHFVSFAWRYHGNAPVSLPPPLRVASVGPGVGHPVSPSGSASVETTGSPKFLGNPDSRLPMFFDPGRPMRP